jgi:hypothetical protein
MLVFLDIWAGGRMATIKASGDSFAKSLTFARGGLRTGKDDLDIKC